MSRYRRTSRPASRSCSRRAARMAIRVRWRAPDDLGTALACFRRAVTAHRRLARLAPRFFDLTVVERERQENQARRRWMESWEAAFIKVYGPGPRPPSPAPELPPLPAPRTQLAVQRELDAWHSWFASGSQALQRFQLRRPHALIDLSRLARLMETASDLGRLAAAPD
jgi:hypothetical protein